MVAHESTKPEVEVAVDDLLFDAHRLLHEFTGDQFEVLVVKQWFFNHLSGFDLPGPIFAH